MRRPPSSGNCQASSGNGPLSPRALRAVTGPVRPSTHAGTYLLRKNPQGDLRLSLCRRDTSGSSSLAAERYACNRAAHLVVERGRGAGGDVVDAGSGDHGTDGGDAGYHVGTTWAPTLQELIRLFSVQGAKRYHLERPYRPPPQ